MSVSEEQIRHSAALAVAAAQEGRWQDAFDHAHTCLRLSPQGSYLRAWALHMLACTYVDASRPQLAEVFARAYLKAVHGIPEAARFTPYVYRVLGSAAYQRRQFRVAVPYYRRALGLFMAAGSEEQLHRARLNLAWALIRAGQLPEASSLLLAMPARDHLWAGAQAALLGAQGRHEEAITVAREALQGARLSHDFVDAAEVALIVAQALSASGDGRAASALTTRAAEFAARQDMSAAALLLLSDRAGGGELLYVRAASARGSADLRDRGCFTTGVG